MKIAVSGCLLGDKVRYDGGHKHDRFITDELGKYAEFISFCPESVVFGIPRPSVKLVREHGVLAVRRNSDAVDVTKELEQGVAEELERLEKLKLSAMIFKARSPSCGIGSTKTYLPNGISEGKDYGLFAKACKEKFPLLPMEEEGRLCDAWLRENFVMQLFAYDAFEKLKASQPKMKELVDFHTRYKFLLQAKDEKLYRELGNVVANKEGLEFSELLKHYEYLFKTAISKKSSIKRNRNVLDHMAGFFKRELTKGEKETLHEQIEEYTKKIVPIIVPLSTIALYAKKYETAYLLNQAFLEPYPKELALRSHLESSK